MNGYTKHVIMKHENVYASIFILSATDPAIILQYF